MQSLELILERQSGFRFSAAHFTSHSGERERLHGHNYSVSLRINGTMKGIKEEGEGNDGILIDFGELKRAVRTICEELHERFLCATLSTTTKCIINQEKKQVELQCLCDGTSFSFPLGDCVLLPLTNSTVEELSYYVSQQLVKSMGNRLKECGVTSLTCGVAELDGQEARYTVLLV
jgi:6-pyruvoyl-tetrahydropterin synthase